MTTRPQCSQTTANGTPCRNRAVEGSDRCNAHLGRIGRDTILTAELTERLCTILRAGNYLHVALRATGLGRSTFHLWMQRGKSYGARDALFHEFREQVSRARAEGEVRNVARIAAAAAESWQAAAWLLERQYPQRWGRPTTRSISVDPTPQDETPARKQTSTPDPFAEIDELATRRRAQQ